MPRELTINLTVSLRPEEYEHLKALAEKEDRSKAGQIRHLIREAMNKKSWEIELGQGVRGQQFLDER